MAARSDTATYRQRKPENSGERLQGGRNRFPDDGNPRTILVGRLRELKSACGSPTYDELARLSGVYKTGLLEAASVTRLPRWHVIKGYAEGCWKYYESEFGDHSRMPETYRNGSSSTAKPAARYQANARRRRPVNVMSSRNHSPSFLMAMSPPNRPPSYSGRVRRDVPAAETRRHRLHAAAVRVGPDQGSPFMMRS